jgi:hypothetical protein
MQGSTGCIDEKMHLCHSSRQEQNPVFREITWRAGRKKISQPRPFGPKVSKIHKLLDHGQLVKEDQDADSDKEETGCDFEHPDKLLEAIEECEEMMNCQ